jgi:hypothetical protein
MFFDRMEMVKNRFHYCIINCEIKGIRLGINIRIGMELTNIYYANLYDYSTDYCKFSP